MPLARCPRGCGIIPDDFTDRHDETPTTCPHCRTDWDSDEVAVDV